MLHRRFRDVAPVKGRIMASETVTKSPPPYMVFVTITGADATPRRYRIGAALHMDQARYMIRENEAGVPRSVDPHKREYSVFRAEWTLEHTE
jgi:hypothetical protein